MRLFIALPIPDNVKEQLANLHQKIRGIRWQDEDKTHLTLKFLGETEPDRARDLKTYLKEISHPEFSMTLNGFGFFPDRNHPKVLWVGIEKNRRLLQLHKRIENTCNELGFESEDRPFRPHITIARTKHATKKEVLSFVNQHKQFRISDVPVHKFILYESKLDSDGAKHIPLQKYQLNSRE